MERKIFESEVKEFNEKDLTVVHFISTERRDRGHDVLYADGMKVEGRPVVLLQHGWTEIGAEPIAKPIWIRKGEFKNRRGIQAKTQFYPDELGRRLWRKTVEGYMPNWSIGWRPLRAEYRTEKDGTEVRHVYEWELLEYSLVSVPMQPDAQTIYDKSECEYPTIHVKMISEKEERRGELVAWKTEGGEWEEKPYPNEHSCRLEDPDKYIRFRRENHKFGEGIHAIWGIQEGGDKPVELQAIRFSKDKFTVSEARKWLKEHDYKCLEFEPAEEKCRVCGSSMTKEFFGTSCDGEVRYVCRSCEEEPRNSSVEEKVQKLSEEVRDLFDRVTALSEAVSVIEERSRFQKSSDPLIVTVVNSEQRRAEFLKAVSDQLMELVRETTKGVVRKELDRIRGKIN